MNPLLTTESLQKALGSSRVVPIDGVPCGGPLDLMRLAVEIKRIQTTTPGAGRATPATHAPPITTEAKPPSYSKERWRELQDLAQSMKNQGATLDAEQLADVLLQSALSQFKAVLLALSPAAPEKQP